MSPIVVFAKKLGATLPRRSRGCSLGEFVGVANMRRNTLVDGWVMGANVRGRAEDKKRPVLPVAIAAMM